MTPAVPDPTVEALSEAERAVLYNAHEADDWAGQMLPAVERILAEHTERAVREALEAAAGEVRFARENGIASIAKRDDRIVLSHPIAEHFESWLRKRAQQIGGRP